jgi:NitT/TauT family transport system ATP-binding protein
LILKSIDREGWVGLSCQGVGFSFSSGPVLVHVLQDLGMEVDDGEFVSVVGPSGCGKSTLLRVIAGMLSPTEGAVSFKGSASGHQDTAMVFQDHALLPWLDVLDNVALPLEAQGMARGERREHAAEMATRLGLGGFHRAYPHQLSGGMRQRAGIARALLADPAVLLMDEPFGSLDAQTRMIMQEELLQTWEHDRRTVVFVTHDIEEAIRLSDRVVVLSGRPARISADIPIPLPRPRSADVGFEPAALSIRMQVWKLLEAEARRHAAT